MIEKLCIFCEHFDFESIGYTYYSTLTGGETSGGMRRKAGRFCEERPYELSDFRKVILKAADCPYYSRDDWADGKK